VCGSHSVDPMFAVHSDTKMSLENVRADPYVHVHYHIIDL
jgi:hypothetical protein